VPVRGGQGRGVGYLGADGSGDVMAGAVALGQRAAWEREEREGGA